MGQQVMFFFLCLLSLVIIDIDRNSLSFKFSVHLKVGVFYCFVDGQELLEDCLEELITRLRTTGEAI